MKFTATKYTSVETGYGVYEIEKSGSMFYTSWWPETILQEDEMANDDFILLTESKKFCKTLEEAKQHCISHLEECKRKTTENIQG